MKLAQFKTKQSAAQRLGLSLNESLIDIASIAGAVKAVGGSVAPWLLDLTDVREGIKRGSDGLGEIKAVVKDAQSRGIASDARYLLALDAVEFLPAVRAA